MIETTMIEATRVDELRVEDTVVEHEMEEEPMVGDVFEEIAEHLALARTKALMGEREEALGLLQGACLEMTRFREQLTGYPGFLALDHSLHTTLDALCAERSELENRHTPVQRALKQARTRNAGERAA
jgi:hypothetical protein